MKTIKINSVKIKPLITHTTNPDDVLGGELFIDPFSNCCIVAKKKSGKTTVLYHILKKVCSKDSNVMIFCSTVHKDETYKKILEMLEKKGCNVLSYTHFIDGKVNLVETLLDELHNPDDEEENKPVNQLFEKSLNSNNPCYFGKVDLPPEEKEEKEQPKKPKKISADWVLIFDDLGADLRNKVISHMSKVLRHTKMRAFYLCQNLYDMDAPMRKQLDYALLFRNFNEEKLKNIYESLDLSIPFETFLEIYDFATKEPYKFLYVDCRNEEYRKCFDKRIVYE